MGLAIVDKFVRVYQKTRTFYTKFVPQKSQRR